MYTKHTTKEIVTDNNIIDFASKQIILEMEHSLTFTNLPFGVTNSVHIEELTLANFLIFHFYILR